MSIASRGIKYSVRGTFLALALLVSLWGVSTYYDRTMLSVTDTQVDIRSLPLRLGPWEGKDLPGLGIHAQDLLRLDNYVRRLYRNNSGEEVVLYVGYWTKQSGDYQAAKHSPAICLPAHGWKIKESNSTQINLEPEPLGVNSVVAQVEHQQALFHYWFFNDRENFPAEWQALFRLTTSAFLRGRSDGGIVEVSTPIGLTTAAETARVNAEKTLVNFISHLLPELQKSVH